MKCSDSDFWRYGKVDGYVCEVFEIDNKSMRKGEAVEYLIKTHNIDQFSAYEYLNNLKHL